MSARMIATTNTTWGFFGTAVTNGRSEVDAAVLFDSAARALMPRLGLKAYEARALLDASIGRHIADALRDGETGDALIKRLYRDRRTSRWLVEASGGFKAPAITLTFEQDEASLLRYALDHALCSISEAHPEDRAHLKAMLERLGAAEKAVRR